MSAPVYTWIVVYEDGDVEIKEGECPSDFTDYIRRVPVAIIRVGYAERW